MLLKLGWSVPTEVHLSSGFKLHSTLASALPVVLGLATFHYEVA